MDEQEYIDSGILYDYCTGLLSEDQKAAVEKVCAQYPGIKDELQGLQADLNLSAASPMSIPNPQLQHSIWNTLENVNKEMAGDINDLPLINKYTDYNNWKRIVKPLMPSEIRHSRITHTLRDADGVMQMLIISKTNVEEEVHINERECFIVLEGECECHIGEDIYRLGPGGFIEIPLHVPHNVKVLSPYVVAVLQHAAV